MHPKKLLVRALPTIGRKLGAVKGRQYKAGDLFSFYSPGNNYVAQLFKDFALVVRIGVSSYATVLEQKPMELLNRILIKRTYEQGGKEFKVRVSFIGSPPADVAVNILRTCLLNKPSVEGMKTALYVRMYGGLNAPGMNWAKKYVPLLQKASDAYYNTENTLLTDAQYDYLEAVLHAIDKNHPFLQKVGALPNERKVELPVALRSLNKVKSGTGDARKWLQSNKGDVVISHKADGISAMIEYRNGKLHQAFSRGDGEVGQIITPHIKTIKNVPHSIEAKGLVRVRGEVCMPNSVFNEKYSKDFANPRNMAGGLLNAKAISPALKDCKFFAHEFIGSLLSKQKTLSKIKQFGFDPIAHVTIPAKNKKKLTDEVLVSMLDKARKEADYDIDGLVMSISMPGLKDTTNTNPKFSMAFKDNARSFKAVVGEVEWDTSRFGYLKPRIRLKKPITHLGVTITYATAHNAAYVKDNGIGPGAVVEMIRSGDVIPYIVKVIKKVKPQLPPNKSKWEWNSTGVDIVLKGGEAAGDPVKVMTYFFASIGAENISGGIVGRLWEHGIRNIPDILDMSIKDWMEVEGIQNRMATKLWNNIHDALTDIQLPVLADASGCFGRGLGSTRLQLLWQEYGNDMMDWKGWSTSAIVEEISPIKSIGVVMARKFAEGVPAFVSFYRSIRKHVTLAKFKKERAVSNVLTGMNFVFTGFRDDSLEKTIKANGGQISSSVNEKSVLVVKDMGSSSSKMVKAKQLGIKIMDKAKFESWLSSKVARK